MMQKVNPLMAEEFSKDSIFDSNNCSNFEIVNLGETTVYLNEIVELKPNEREYFPPLGHCNAYYGPVSMKFKAEKDKTNKVIVKASRYV